MTEKRLRKRGLFGRKTVTTFLPPHSNYVRPKYKVGDKNVDYEDVTEETFGGNLTARIVIHSLLKTPTTSAFLMDFCDFPYHLRTPFSRKSTVGGRELVRHHLVHEARYCKGFG